MNYIESDAGAGEDQCSRGVAWHEPEELKLVLVPLNWVELLAVRVEVTAEGNVLVDVHYRRHHYLGQAQAHRPCNKTQAEYLLP